MESNQKAAAFNLIIEGLGYLSRVRTVTPKKGPAYTAVTINAMMGQAGEVEYLSIDCRVVGQQAKTVVSMLEGAVGNRQKVIVGFRAGDPKPDFYQYEDRKTNEMVKREGLKARLLQITHAKVDGVRQDVPTVERKSEANDVPQERSHEGTVPA